jgi:hypothetical protein
MRALTTMKAIKVYSMKILLGRSGCEENIPAGKELMM